MPRETIRRLSFDIERVLVAGAHLAAADPALARDRQALDGLAAQLGAKAPVIGQLAAATGKAIAAGGKEAARELVGLATMAAQVRAAQAQPAPAPTLEPLTPRPAIGTPCRAKELGEVYRALIETGKGRMEVLQQAIERGDIADLRLVEALIHAMNDGWIGDMVATKALPCLGAAIVAPIRSAINFEKARAIDGRRLRALVAVDPAGSRDLLSRALAEGNAELREAALDAIADHVRGDPTFEAPVLEVVAKERSGGVFRAALRALAGYASDATLSALTVALDDARTVYAAAEGLGHSRHPQALKWMLERLRQAVEAAAAAKKAGTKKDDKAPAQAVAPAEMVGVLLKALAKQKDPRIAGVAMALIADHGEAAAEAALASADAKQLATLADLLASDDAELFPVAANAATMLGSDQVFKRLSAVLSDKDREKKLGLARIEAASHSLHGDLDPRWAGFCLKQLDGPAAVQQVVIPLLATLKETKARKPLLAILASGKNAAVLATSIQALGVIGGVAVIPAILAFHDHKDWSLRWAVQHAIMAIDDPAAVDLVRSALVAQQDPEAHVHGNLRNLLQHLERRFPGK